jgi:putative transposase
VWTDTTRKQFARSGLRLPSDLTDAKWRFWSSCFRAVRTGAPVWSYRQTVEARSFLLRGGLPWRML